MTEQAQSNDNTFIGIMIMKDGKWTPHSKFDLGALGSALLKAKDLDKDRDLDGVKVVKLSAGGNNGGQDVWVSPRFEAAAKARTASKVRDGENQTREQFANAHQERKANLRRT
jgi:hypothetical protein